MKPYKLIKDEPQHYIIHDGEGQFYVAKKGLSPKIHTHITGLQSFADGGEVNAMPDPMADTAGTPDIATTEPTPAPGNPPFYDEDAFQARFKQRLAQKGALYGGIEQVPQQVQQAAASEAIQDVHQAHETVLQTAKEKMAKAAQQQEAINQAKIAAGLPPTPQAPTPEQAAQIPQVPANQQVASTAPTPTEAALKTPMQQYQEAFAQQEKGIKGMAEAQVQAAKGQAAAYGHEIKGLKAAQETYQTRLKDLSTETDRIYRSALDEKIKPSQYWQSLSAGSKIGAIAAMTLGGVGGRELASSVINKAIDQDIEAQKANMQHKDNLFKMNLDRTKNAQEAAEMTKAQLLALTAAQVQQATAQAGSAEAKARGDLLLGQLGQQVAETNQKLALFNAKAQLVGGGASVNPELLEEKDRERVVQMPNGKQNLAYSPKGAEEVRAHIQTLQPILHQLDKLDQLGPSALIPNSKANQQAQAIRAALVPMVNENAGLKRLSSEDIQNINQMFRDPTSFKQLLGGQARSQAFRDFLSDKSQSLFSQQLEGYRTPRQIGIPWGAK